MKDQNAQRVIELISHYGTLERIKLLMPAIKVEELEHLLEKSNTISDIVDEDFPIHRSFHRKGKVFKDAIFTYSQCLLIFAEESVEGSKDYYDSFNIVI